MTNNLVRENNGTSSSQQSEKFVTPVASVQENADGYTVELEMPGVNKEGLEISVEHNQLSITGRKQSAVPEGTLVHRESRPHHFRRSFEIDPSIDSAKITARMSQGMVTLTLPKTEEVKPRQIAVG